MANAERVERVRAAVRQALHDGHIGDLMRLTGLSDGAIYQFTQEGSATQPYARTLASYERALSTLRHSTADGGDGGTPLPGNVPTGASNGEGPTVTLPLHELTYWRGIVESEWRHIGSTSKALEHLLSMLNDATKGIGRFVESGLLPEPQADLTPEELARITGIRAAIEARRRRERGETGTDEP